MESIAENIENYNSYGVIAALSVEQGRVRDSRSCEEWEMHVRVALYEKKSSNLIWEEQRCQAGIFFFSPGLRGCREEKTFANTYFTFRVGFQNVYVNARKTCIN